jgi:hypothetical protein
MALQIFPKKFADNYRSEAHNKNQKEFSCELQAGVCPSAVGLRRLGNGKTSAFNSQKTPFLCVFSTLYDNKGVTSKIDERWPENKGVTYIPFSGPFKKKDLRPGLQQILRCCNPKPQY